MLMLLIPIYAAVESLFRYDEETESPRGDEEDLRKDDVKIGNGVMLPMDEEDVEEIEIVDVQEMDIVDMPAWLERMETLIGVEPGVGSKLERRRSSVY